MCYHRIYASRYTIIMQRSRNLKVKFLITRRFCRLAAPDLARLGETGMPHRAGHARQHRSRPVIRRTHIPAGQRLVCEHGRLTTDHREACGYWIDAKFGQNRSCSPAGMRAAQLQHDLAPFWCDEPERPGWWSADRRSQSRSPFAVPNAPPCADGSYRANVAVHPCSCTRSGSRRILGSLTTYYGQGQDKAENRGDADGE
jgi:hypothetical protein